MNRLTYAELLKTDMWRAKRKRILKRDLNSCRHCHKTGGTLHVHHTYYLSGMLPWQYPDSALITLCPKCHKAVHENKDISEFTKTNAKKANKKSQKKRKSKKPKKSYDPVLSHKQRQAQKVKARNEQRQKELEALREERRKESLTYNLPEYQHLRQTA